MFHHIVMWDFKEGVNAQDAQKIKEALEGLKAHIPQIIELKLHINQLSYSTKDAMLISQFANEADFLTYVENPHHKAVVGMVKELFENRVAFDYATH